MPRSCPGKAGSPQSNTTPLGRAGEETDPSCRWANRFRNSECLPKANQKRQSWDIRIRVPMILPSTTTISFHLKQNNMHRITETALHPGPWAREVLPGGSHTQTQQRPLVDEETRARGRGWLFPASPANQGQTWRSPLMPLGRQHVPRMPLALSTDLWLHPSKHTQAGFIT